MKKFIGLVLITLMTVTNAYADYTVKIITDKVLPITNLYLIGIDDNWNISSDSKALTVESQTETTKTWSYTSGNNHAFKIVINHRNWDNIYSTSNISFTADDPSAENKVMTITLQYATVRVTAPECTDKVYLLGGWNEDTQKAWKNESSNAVECALSGTDSGTGRPIFTGYIIRNYDVNFKCYNRVGSWDYEEAADDHGANTEQHTGVPGNTANVQVDYWKQKAYECPAPSGDITLTITVPEGTDSVYLVGSWGNNWKLSEAIKCTSNGNNSFTGIVPNVVNVEYKCYNHISWNHKGCWHYEEKTAGGESVSNRTLSFSNGAEQSITVANWENKGYEQHNVTITITNVPKCTDQVWLRGGWLNDDWTKSYNDAIQAIQQPDGSFQATIFVADGKHFKCYNRSNDWETVEYNGSGAGISQRTISGTSMEFSVAEWKTEPFPCSGDITVTITTPPGTEELYLAGNWGNSWKLSEAKQCTKTADRTFTYTFENISGAQFKCLNKNTAVNNEWVYEERKADGGALDGNRIINFKEAEEYDFTVAKWRKPYQVGYSDQMDNSETSTFYNAQSVNVILSGRTLRGGMYNTLCLPFALASLDGTPLEGVTLKSMTNAVQVGDELQLVFEDATSIEAGKPYLINPGEEDIIAPIFSDVSISKDVTAQYDAAPGIRFHGILAPTHLPASEDYLFLSSNNTLTWPLDDGKSMPGMRAYFELVGSATNAPVRRARIVEPSQVVTAIESVTEESANEKYLENGTIVIRRDGKTYNVLGQQIR